MTPNWESHGRSEYHLGCHIEREVKQRDGKHVDFQHEWTASVSVQRGAYVLLILKGIPRKETFPSLVALNGGLTKLGYPALRII